MELKEKIHLLINQQWSYSKISEILECSKGSVAYHYNNTSKAKNILRNRVNGDVYRKRNRQYVWDYLKDNPCEGCGIDNPKLLEFHHVKPEEKHRAVSVLKAGRWSVEAIQKEIDKCIVLCSNCHRLETAEQLNHYETVDE